MFPAPVDNVLMELASLKKDLPLISPVKERIHMLEIELGFLKMFIWFLPRKSLKKYYIRETVGKGKLGVCGTRNLAHKLDLAASKLLQKVEFCKGNIRNDCLYLLDFPSDCRFSDSYEFIHFINCTLGNFRILVRSKSGAIVYARKQFRALVKQLRIFRDFVKITGKWFYFGFDVRDWACNIACVSMLFWTDHMEMEEAMAARMEGILVCLLHKVRSYSPEVIGLYIRALKASKISSFNPFKVGEVVASFVDFLFPIGFMKILREELIFLMTILMHPREMEINTQDWDLVLIKARGVASEIPSLICSLIAAEMNQETAQERDNLISNFQEKTDKVKAEVRKLLSALNPQSSRSDSLSRERYFQIRSHFPTTNSLGFIDTLLENLGNLKEASVSQPTFLPFVRDQLVTLYKELVSIKPYLKNIQEMQDEFLELKALLMQITHAAYQAEHVIDSCQIFDVPIWYNVLCLSDVIEEMKIIKRQTRKIMDNQIQTKSLDAKANSDRIYLGQAYTSRLDEVVVGFEDEAEAIVDRLTRGSMKLEIVPIVGMPGQGKTTLAKKVYNSPSIRHYFTKCAWCFVTQIYEDKMLLLNILREVTTKLDKIYEMSKEDLAEKLYKCLKGQRYLIILDDVWDIIALDAVKESFPDNKNGSRILFTSRNKFCDNPHLLRPLSGKESIELLKQKLLPEEGWLSNFSGNLEHILKVCNGLPLAIVVIAGMLKSVSNNLDQWRQIVQKLSPKQASEGCMDILELSYKNLPDFLKPCFLYLGAQTKVFKVPKLIQLWIAEEFVQKSGIKSLEEVAREYLEDLVARSLVIVNKRSFSSGEIKECRIHDLLHEFCLRKAEEERFINFSRPRNYSSETITYDQYRVCIYYGWIFPSSTKPIGPNLRSLLIPLSNTWVPCPNVSTYPFFIRLKFLRVLDLATVDFRDYFPAEILFLICLRYLSIKCEIKEVPSSIGNLYNLETFHVVRKGGKEGILLFPHIIWKMKTLRNVTVGRVAILLLDDHDDYMCPQLGNVDSFSSLYLSNVADAEKLLKGFPRIRKLKLEISDSWDCGRTCNQFQVLHSLSKLESLNLQYSRHVAHTCQFNFSTALKELTLSGSNHPWNEMSTIGKLPNLEVLKLLCSAIVGNTWDVEDDEFPNLKYLKLSELDISHWEAPASSFPCLERLVVRDCHFLIEFPKIFEDVLTLKMIQVSGCLKSLGTSAVSLRNERWDMGNDDLEVQISNVLRDDL